MPDVYGYADYHALGPLTAADLARLDGMTSDQTRRQHLGRIYGRRGGTYAWHLYQLRQTAPQTSPGHVPRHLHGRHIDTIQPAGETL